MDDKLWGQINAAARAIERATAGIDMQKLTLAADTAQRLASTFDFGKTSATLAAGEQAFRQYERMSTNAALVGGTIANVLARSSALPDLSSPVFTKLQLSPPAITAFRVSEFRIAENAFLLSTRAHELAHLNDAVSGAMSSIAFDNLAAFDRSLGRRIVSLSDSYRDIFADLPNVDFALPDFVTELPARDMIVKSTIVASRANDFEPAEAGIDLDDPAYARSDVDLMLADLNPNYVTMLDEAFDALSGNALGRRRYVLVSLRELLTHVLHHLSPDDGVQAWTDDPKQYHNGKPTRAARYVYICRNVHYGPYGEYLKKSARMTSAFFELLNTLHEARPDVSEFQLRLILTDAIGLLRFLLRTERHRP
jgi:hypothetical protein